MTSGKEAEERQHLASQQAHAYYGTFQGNPAFPQPVHPSQAPQYPQYPPAVYERIEQGIPVDPHHYHHHHHHDDHHQHHHRRHRLPCCGLGMGWCLFIIGFFTFSVPWFVGAFIFFCFEHDAREHIGLAACAIAAVIAILVGGTSKGLHAW